MDVLERVGGGYRAASTYEVHIEHWVVFERSMPCLSVSHRLAHHSLSRGITFLIGSALAKMIG